MKEYVRWALPVFVSLVVINNHLKTTSGLSCTTCDIGKCRVGKLQKAKVIQIQHHMVHQVVGQIMNSIC